MGKYTTLLFDFDGTIGDTDDVIVQTFLTLYKMYRKGEPTPIEQIYYFSGPPIRETLKKEFPELDLQFILDEFHRISWDYYSIYLKPVKGCLEVLKELKDLGYKMGVVTNKIHKNTVYCLKLLHMEDYFDSIVAFDDVSKGKPDKEPMLKAMHELGEEDVTKTLYIGDNLSDYISAKNASMDCAIVCWGPRVLDKSANPKYRLSNFNELKEVLN